MRRSAFAPGRVNLIGEHTDYNGGYVLPMAIQLGTTVAFEPGGRRILLRSASEPEPADLPLELSDVSAVRPDWARYVAGVISEIRPARGGSGTVTTTLPIGAGLSSSAALEVATALALGYAGPPQELALTCQRAEQRASGLPCGAMDQLACALGVEGHALLIDCSSNQIEPVPLPPDAEVIAIHSGETRSLAATAYAERRLACEQAESLVGPLRSASLEDVEAMANPVLRRRARHVVTENRRVLEFVQCLRSADLRAAGYLMQESHASLREDFQVSTPRLDGLVDSLMATPGVYGARLTGAGFGGCVVAFARPGAISEGWLLKPSSGARLLP